MQQETTHTPKETMYQILCNMKGSRSLQIEEMHLATIEDYALFSELLDSNGFVDENVLEKLRLNVRALLDNTNGEPRLVRLCQDVLFHPHMKAFGLHQLILLYIDWEKEKLDALKGELEPESEA